MRPHRPSLAVRSRQHSVRGVTPHALMLGRQYSANDEGLTQNSLMPLTVCAINTPPIFKSLAQHSISTRYTTVHTLRKTGQRVQQSLDSEICRTLINIMTGANGAESNRLRAQALISNSCEPVRLRWCLLMLIGTEIAVESRKLEIGGLHRAQGRCRGSCEGY